MAALRAAKRDEDYQPDMPPVEHCWHLIGYLFDVGPVQPAGAGMSAVSHQEIESWQRLRCLDLQPWEVQFLRRLSTDYLMQQNKAEKVDCDAPWEPDFFRPLNKRVLAQTNNLRAHLKSLAQGKVDEN